jgi:hypothetical protein
VDPRTGLDSEVEEKNLLPLPGTEHGSSGRPVRNQKVVTELPQLQEIIITTKLFTSVRNYYKFIYVIFQVITVVNMKIMCNLLGYRSYVEKTTRRYITDRCHLQIYLRLSSLENKHAFMIIISSSFCCFVLGLVTCSN